MTAKERLDQVELERLAKEESMVMYNDLSIAAILIVTSLFGETLEINNGRITAAIRPL